MSDNKIGILSVANIKHLITGIIHGDNGEFDIEYSKHCVQASNEIMDVIASLSNEQINQIRESRNGNKPR